MQDKNIPVTIGFGRKVRLPSSKTLAIPYFRLRGATALIGRTYKRIVAVYNFVGALTVTRCVIFFWHSTIKTDETLGFSKPLFAAIWYSERRMSVGISKVVNE